MLRNLTPVAIRFLAERLVLLYRSREKSRKKVGGATKTASAKSEIASSNKFDSRNSKFWPEKVVFEFIFLISPQFSNFLRDGLMSTKLLSNDGSEMLLEILLGHGCQRLDELIQKGFLSRKNQHTTPHQHLIVPTHMTHTYIHTYIHTCIHTCIHTYFFRVAIKPHVPDNPQESVPHAYPSNLQIDLRIAR